MAAARPQSSTQQESISSTLGVLLIAFMFLITGLGAIALLISNISSVVNAALPDEPTGQTLLNFLYTYGIIVPVLLVGIGIYSIFLSVQLFQRKATAASWARQLLLWFVVLMVVLIVQGLTLGPVGVTINLEERVNNVIPYALVLVVALLGYLWMGRNMQLYIGQETLVQASARSAWNLLVPTIVLLLVVALRPLEKTFVASLTDDTFAGGVDESVNFIGLENYARLLSFRFDILHCETDPATGACLTTPDGSIVFPRPRAVLDESYTDMRYREVFGIDFGDSRLIFSGRDTDFWSAVGNTLYFTFFSVLLELVLGLFIAMVINSKFRGRGLMRTAMLIPWAIPTVVSARLWGLMLRDNSSGVINSVLLQLGVISSSQAWLANQALQIPALIAIDVWKTTPFMALILLAGLQVIPGEIYEAAQVDGATGVRRFFSITLPLLAPAITIALVFRTLDAIRVFDLFQVLLGRGKLSLATYNYDTLVGQQQLGYASAIGVVIFVLILIFTVLYVRVLGVKAE